MQYVRLAKISHVVDYYSMIDIKERENILREKPDAKDLPLLDAFFLDLLSWEEFAAFLEEHQYGEKKVHIITTSSARKAFLLWSYLRGEWPAEEGMALKLWLKENIRNGNGALKVPVYCGEIADGSSVYVVPANGETPDHDIPVEQARLKRDSVFFHDADGVPPELVKASAQTVVSVDTVQQNLTPGGVERYLGKPADDDAYRGVPRAYIEEYFPEGAQTVHITAIAFLRLLNGEIAEDDTVTLEMVARVGRNVEELVYTFDEEAAGAGIFLQLLAEADRTPTLAAAIMGMPVEQIVALLAGGEIPEDERKKVLN